MRFEQNLCNVKIFHLQPMLNATTYIDERFAVKNSDISCLANFGLDIQLAKSENESLAIKKLVLGCWI